MNDRKNPLRRKDWLPLDNASKIFLSTMTTSDKKVFRLTAALKEKVRPDILQKALTRAHDEFDLYHTIIRRGYFWYFMEKSDIEPKVEKEKNIVCAQIYHKSYRGLLYKILYSENRIHLEVFHSLSDGSGAMSFFQLVLIAYFHFLNEGQKDALIFPSYESHDLSLDAFLHFNFKEALRGEHQEKPLDEQTVSKAAKVLRIKGRHTPDARQNILEAHFRTSHVLLKARETRSTITTYLAACFALALYDAATEKQKSKACQVVLSCPIDLRQHYPNLSARNFFATLLLSYTFKPGEKTSIAEISQSFSRQLKMASVKENISRKVAQFINYEKILAIRLLPLYFKDFFLRTYNTYNNQKITAALTNLGRFRLPEKLTSNVEEIVISTSAVRPQLSIISYEKDLSICFTSPLADSKVQDTCLKIIEEDGLKANFVVEAKAENLSEGKIIKAKDKRVSSQHTPYPKVKLGSNFPLATVILSGISLLSIIFYFIFRSKMASSFTFVGLLIFLTTAWLETRTILTSRHNPAWLILRQSLTLGLGVVFLDLFTGNGINWSISFAIPAIFTGSLIASEIVLIAMPKAKVNGLSFHMLSILVMLLPLLSIMFDWVKPIWPSLITIGLALVSLILNMIFRRKQIWHEQKKKWYF